MSGAHDALSSVPARTIALAARACPALRRLASNRTVGEICVRNEYSRESHRRRRSRSGAGLSPVTPGAAEGRGVIQTKRVYEFAAGRTARRKELLEVTQRDSRLGRDLARVEIRISEAVLDDATDARKQLVRMARDGGGLDGANSAPR